MDYTPRQLAAFLALAERRRKADLSEQLHLNTLAARGDEQAVRNQLREWSTDG
jgi:hypothetical protein